MPSLKAPTHRTQLTLPPRRALIAADTDVLVIGGGPAGIGAALGAARAGAEVILAERYGFLGGNATAALVMPFMSYHAQYPAPQRPGSTQLFPSDHSRFRDPVIAGVVADFVRTLVAAGGALEPSPETGFVLPFDPEVFKAVALDILDGANVRYLLHAFAAETLDSPRVSGVVFETKSGPMVIRARNIVDCTGDGDIAWRAGAAYEIGRDDDALVQPMTLMFRIADFEHTAFKRYVEEHPDQWLGVHGLWDLVQRANIEMDLQLPREDILLFGTPHPHEVAVNSTRVTRVLGTDVWDLSYAERESRRQMQRVVTFLRRYVPGFEHSYAVQSGVQIGVRETRRIAGDYRLEADDVLNAQKFDDAIARCAYPIDIHNPTGRGTRLQRLPPGETYDIPLRCLLPQGIDHLLVAGRCISGSHEAVSSYRVMPVAMATGQAAGVCAALAAKQGITPRTLSVRELQRELLRQGADLGERFIH